MRQRSKETGELESIADELRRRANELRTGVYRGREFNWRNQEPSGWKQQCAVYRYAGSVSNGARMLSQEAENAVNVYLVSHKICGSLVNYNDAIATDAIDVAVILEKTAADLAG
jgi:hypothetical protein